MGVYLGHSSEHAWSIPLGYSTTSGLVSPKFHIIFNDKFSTMQCLHGNKLPSNWPELFNTSSLFYVDEDFNKTNFYQPSSFDETSLLTSFQGGQSPPQPHSTRIQRQDLPSDPSPSSVQDESHSSIQQPNNHPSSVSSSSIHVGWNHNHNYNTRFKRQYIANSTIPSSSSFFDDSTLQALLSSHNFHPVNTDVNFPLHQHSAFTAEHKDTLHFGEIQYDPGQSHFEADMQRELSDLIMSGTIKITPCSSVPLDNKPLQPIWSFRRKRAPDWSILKYKSRLCPNGGMQVKGINCWPTYAPVVSWRTVRLMQVD